MKLRVGGCYWSKGQFRHRGITMFGSFLQSLWSSDKVYSGQGADTAMQLPRSGR
jgi:hypothetical protein